MIDDGKKRSKRFYSPTFVLVGTQRPGLSRTFQLGPNLRSDWSHFQPAFPLRHKAFFQGLGQNIYLSFFAHISLDIVREFSYYLLKITELFIGGWVRVYC